MSFKPASFERVTYKKVVFRAFSIFIIFQTAFVFLKSPPVSERMKKLNLAAAYFDTQNIQIAHL